MKYTAIYTVAFGRPFAVTIDAKGSKLALAKANDKTTEGHAYAFAQANARRSRPCPLASDKPSDWTLFGVFDGLRPSDLVRAQRLIRRGASRETAMHLAQLHAFGDVIGTRKPGDGPSKWRKAADIFYRYGVVEACGEPMLSGVEYACERGWIRYNARSRFAA